MKLYCTIKKLKALLPEYSFYYVCVFIISAPLLLYAKKSFGQDLDGIGKQKPFQISGELNFSTGYYHSKDGYQKLKSFGQYLTGSTAISIFGISFPFSMIADGSNASFTQPFNQYGVNPYYKWAIFHGGYSSVYFSDYTLSGAPFFGGGIELNPRKFRFGFIKGRFQKAVRDTGTAAYYSVPAYERWGCGVKAGWGTEKIYVDLIGFKTKDKIGSLPLRFGNFFVTPKENVCLGIKSAANLEKIDFQLDAAVSTITPDLTGIKKEIKDNRWAFLKKFLKSNRTAFARFGGEASGGYIKSKWGIRASYKRIEPDFDSPEGLGYYSSDIQQFTLKPSLRLLKTRLRINSSFGIQQDDLLHVKDYKTQKDIISFSVNYTHNSFISGGINFSNYGTSQQSGKLQLNDSIRLSFISLSYGAYINLTKVNSFRRWQIGLSITKSEFLDNNIITRAYTQTKSLLSNIRFNYSFIPKKLLLSSNINAYYFRSALDTSFYCAYNTEINYTLLKDKLTTSFNSTMTFKKTAGKAREHMFNINSSLNYVISSQHSLSISISSSKNIQKISSSIYLLKEQQINVSYNHTF